jgi:hypothetical protein
LSLRSNMSSAYLTVFKKTDELTHFSSSVRNSKLSEGRT